MNLFTKWWKADGTDFISARSRMILSIVVTGIVGFLLEFIGIEVLHAFENASPYTLYFVTAIWAFGLGPVIVLFRKSFIIIPMAIVGLIFGFLVLYNHYHFIIWEFAAGKFIDTGKLSSPRIWEFSEGAILGLKNPLAIAAVAGLIETIVVPVSVFIQKLLTLKFKKNDGENLDEIKNLFESSVPELNSFKPKRGFDYFLMRFIFYAYGIYFVYMIIGLIVGGRDLPIVNIMFINPPETVNTVMKLTLMISLAAIGAFNKNMVKPIAIVIAAGHMISVVASLWMYFTFSVNPLFPEEQQLLLATVVGDGLLVLGLVYIIAGKSPEENELDKIEDIELRSPASTILKTYFLIFSILFSLFTIAIVYFRIAGNPESGLGAVFGGPDPLVSNSLTKYGTLALMGWMLYARPFLRKFLIPVLIIAFTFSLIATFVYAFNGTTVLINRLGNNVSLPWFMTQHILVDGGGLFLLIYLRKLQYKVDFQITSISPSSSECIISLNNSFRETEQNAASSSRIVLIKIDEQIAGIKGRRRGLVGFPFWLIENVFPLIQSFRPPFSTMSRVEQRWMLRKYLLKPHFERVKAFIPFLADFEFQMTDISHAILSLSFFTTPQGHSLVKYIVPDARGRLQKEVPSERPPDNSAPFRLPGSFNDPSGKQPLSNPSEVSKNLSPYIGAMNSNSQIPDEVDYCVVGSGAAGGLIAYRLGAAKGQDNSICVIERGGYFLPMRDFSDDEMRMTRLLYSEGGLQTSRSFDFTILQGECVGGSTVINNAVCFRMPEISKYEWETFGIDTDQLKSHYDKVENEINIKKLSDISVNKLGESLFINGVNSHNNSAIGMGVLTPADRNAGNFNNCIGCGLCNIACKYMRKLSVLETYIPWARSHNVNVISNVGAVQCTFENSGARKKVKELIVRNVNGNLQRIRIKKALIVSAGAIASSRFLMRSKAGGKYAGQNVSCNFAVPPLAVYDDVINAYDGLQISMYAFPESHEAVFETTFNPPGTYSIALQNYFHKHSELMSYYANSVNFTALVASDPAGTVSIKRDLLFGRATNWEQTPDDILRIKKALSTIINIARGSGAKKLYLPTHPVFEINLRDGNVDNILKNINEKLNDKKYFNFITAHPQGGNRMASDTHDERVVDLDFRVRDCENLFVCDASIFPKSVRVNPQWTIMALASLAGEKIISGT